VGGGLIFTASHNPPEYNGVKFNPPTGGPAPVSITNRIEAFISNPPASVVGLGSVVMIDPREAFAEFIRDYVIGLGIELPIQQSIAVDCRHGTAGPIWHHIARLCGLTILISNDDARSDFGGIEPNPTHPDSQRSLGQEVLIHHANLGVAHDPDADRHAICDELGQPVSPEIVSAIIMSDMVRSGIAVDGIASTVASSGVVKALCEHLGKSYFETAVGFKYFAPFFEGAVDRVIGVESSGGFSISDYLYEKCGFLPAILVAAAAARQHKTVSQLGDDINAWVGQRSFLEKSFRFDGSKRGLLLAELNTLTPFSGAQWVLDVDGRKWIWADGTWLLIRLSGTEPVGRIYSESTDPVRAQSLTSIALDWASQFI
jgi:phosphomannomutase